MTRDLSYESIGYEGATFKVDTTTKTYLETNYKDAATGKVDVNDLKLAVVLKGDNTVGFGTGTPTKADALFGFIKTYEQDGFATVQYAGYMEEVPVDGVIALGTTTLAVNDKGVISSVADTAGRAIVTKASTSNDKKITVLVG